MGAFAGVRVAQACAWLRHFRSCRILARIAARVEPASYAAVTLKLQRGACLDGSRDPNASALRLARGQVAHEGCPVVLGEIDR